MPDQTINEHSGTSAWVLSANDLLLGDLVYLDANHQWTHELVKAKIMEGKEAAEKTLQDIASSIDNVVVGAELSPVLVHADNTLEFTRLRDRFREAGPTHKAGLPRESYSRSSLSL